MNKISGNRIVILAVIILMMAGFLLSELGKGSVVAQVPYADFLYTTDADFDQGTLVSVNHDAPFNDQLQLNSPTEPFPFINVAASGRGTVVRSNTETGEVVGEYRTAPEGRELNPSRTTVDLFGNVWTANRDEAGLIDGVPRGSAVKIGLIAGGTRVDSNGVTDPEGGYLAPPFGYNTCVDRDNDGLIRTSKGLDDILDWPDYTDGDGGADGLVEDATDECILIYQRLPDAENARHVSVDADNNVWVGGYPFALRMFYKLDGASGAFLDSFDARDIGCGGYGGLVDGNGILWSVGGQLLRYDPATGTGTCIEENGYGLGIDTNGYIWMSIWDGGIVKIAPDGTVLPGFPKPTYPPAPATTAVSSTSRLVAAVPRSALAAPIAPLVAGDPNVTFQVAPVDNWVQSSSPWTPGATISLTIEDGSGEVYTDSQTADSAGNFNFNLWDVFDVQRGHVVTISDGTTTKTHTVADLFVDGVDVTADTVFGRAAAGSSVNIWVHDDGDQTVTADGFGNWTADFSGTTDLTFLSDGGSQQFDDDGDSTGVWWASPRFEVAPEDNWVQSTGSWPPGSTISLTIEDGSGVLYSDSQKADDNGYFNFGLWDVFDLERGQLVTVTDGTNTKTHTVADLFVDGMDVAADSVFGRAIADSSVYVWVHGDGDQTVTADGSGNWTADFSGMADFTNNTDGGSRQTDADGDSTGVWWESRKIQAAPDDDWVQSRSRWTPGATVTLTISGGGAEAYSDTQTVDTNGSFHFNFRDLYDLQRGQLVTVSDGIITKAHTVTGLFVDGVNPAADTVSGRAAAGTAVEVWVHGDNSTVTAAADGSGNWTADFSGITDLTYASDGGSQQIDADGDSTGVWWSSPKIEVAPDDDWVQSWGPWTPGANILLTIADDNGILYTDSQTADDSGNFHFNLWEVFDLKRGHLVTVSDGTNTKTHTVTNLYVDGVDAASDHVFGRANVGSDVEVWVHGHDGNVTVTTDGSGNWTADFSGMADLTYLSDGGSRQVDDDGDTTGVWWASPNFEVSPEENWVRSWNRWTAGATISVTIEDGGSVPYSDSQTADNHGNFHMDVGVDIMPGYLVTVSDGTTIKTHTVIDVADTSIDVDAEQVSGTAGPGAQVRVWASLFDHGSGRWVTADVGGNWTAYFSVAAEEQPAYDISEITRIDVNEFDDDGDATYRRFGPPLPQNRGVAVTPIDNHVWVASTLANTITRLDNDGNVVKVIDNPEWPSGVAVDAAGKVWATNMGSNNIVRIDPNAGADGLGKIDLTVNLGPGANPYNYSDMTGAVVVGSTSPQGFWTVIQDSSSPGFEWGRITWNSEPEGNVPEGSAIVVEARTADSETGLGRVPFVEVDNGLLFSSFGRYIEVRATLKASMGGASPVLSDLRIQPHVIPVEIDIKPGSDPNSINCQNVKEVITIAVLTTSDFDALTVDHTTVSFEEASETHVNKRSGEPRRHEEDVDNDGDMDLVFHFRLADTTLTCGSTEGTLVGETVDGIPVEGTDAVRMVKTE